MKNENKNYDNVFDIAGTYGSKESIVNTWFDTVGSYETKVTTENTRVYKARKTCGMLILTAPLAVKGQYYVDRVNEKGVITYTPLGEIPLDVFATEKLHTCKALETGGGVGLNARLATPGAYYYSIVNKRGVITYIPTNLVAQQIRGDM